MPSNDAPLQHDPGIRGSASGQRGSIMQADTALAIAARCATGTRVECLSDQSLDDPTSWLRECINALCAPEAYGALYVFIRQPLSTAMLDVLRWAATDRHLPASVVATGAAVSSAAHLEQLQSAEVRALYVTLHGATAATHDRRTGEPGSWRRALLLLTKAPQLVKRVRVGAHLTLSPATANEVLDVLRLIDKLACRDLLLWDAGCRDADIPGWDRRAALRSLDHALTAAQKFGVRARPVGFERTRTAALPRAAHAGVCSPAIVEVLRDGIELPSAAAGLLATDGKRAGLVEVAATGHAAAQIAFELAAGGWRFLDLPACLGGAPPTDRPVQRGGIKVEACERCPIEPGCSGVPPALMKIPDLREEIRPPCHWTGIPVASRVLVLCPIVVDTIYGATFFSLARALAGLGARVDVATSSALHEDVPSSLPQCQPIGSPKGTSVVARFIAEGALHRYDLILAPDIPTARMLVESCRLRPDTRLAVADFHMLGGMPEWARSLCGAGRRPEEGGWWPSDRITLFSAFPGYAQLYTRCGVPMRQVVWQPFALDPDSFVVEQRPTDAASIISGGTHRRDLATLLKAAERLGPSVHPIDLYSEEHLVHLPRQIRFHGAVNTSVFCPAVGRSRFMVVPLTEDPRNAAGITAMTTAMMCGRPIVATSTAAARDYVTPGVNGLLVPPNDPQALAEAIERIDTDLPLLTALAAGAAAAADKLTTQAWARALLHGSRMYDAAHWMWTKWLHRGSWPDLS